ncbi:MAG: DUF4381 domain-containing protein [Gammaproteobacteria bacterium]|nr:DUF4381 domain-containing protein [Gammaproteobacteria bacterium]
MTDLPLRDIHLPEPVFWWPPAPGWWWLLALLLLALTLYRLAQRRRRNTRLRREGLRALNRLQAEYQQSGDSKRVMQQLSSLLRRIALSRYPRPEVAALTGSEWLEFLDRSLVEAGGMPAFRSEIGALLTEAPYRPDCSTNPEPLFELSREWITRIGASGGGGTG